jgi:hypothetical protein
VRPLDSTDARELPGTDSAERPFWSPDSRSLGFVALGKLKRIDLTGGSAQTLAEGTGFGAAGGEGSWNSDGKILFATSANSNLFLISASGGDRSEATRLDSTIGEGSHLWPEFLPDGKRYLYHVRTAGGAEFQIYAGTLGSSQRTLLLKGVTNARYAPPRGGYPGYLLYVRDGTLMAQPFDDRRLTLTGDPITVTQPVLTTINATGADFSVSPGGILAYRGGAVTRGEELAWHDRAGKQIASVLSRPDPIVRPRLSPDGKTVAFGVGRQGSGQTQDIWLQDLARHVASRFTFAGAVAPGCGRRTDPGLHSCVLACAPVRRGPPAHHPQISPPRRNSRLSYGEHLGFLPLGAMAFSNPSDLTVVTVHTARRLSERCVSRRQSGQSRRPPALFRSEAVSVCGRPELDLVHLYLARCWWTDRRDRRSQQK